MTFYDVAFHYTDKKIYDVRNVGILCVFEREILLNAIAGIINMQPTNDIFLRIMTSSDITVVKSLAKFIYGCFKQIKG